MSDELVKEVFERLDESFAKIGEYAPVVWNKMVLLTQVESIAWLGVGGFCAFAALVTLILLFGKGSTGQDKYGDFTISPKGLVFLGFQLFWIPALGNLLYIWNWIGAFSPESRLIARLIGAVTGSSS